jgi:hypothetical protein
LEGDGCETGSEANELYALPTFDAGGLTETLADQGNTQVLCTALQGNAERILASLKESPEGGKVGFVRSILPISPAFYKAMSEIETLPPDQNFQGEWRSESSFHSERLMRYTLSKMGWHLGFSALDAQTDLPRPAIFRHENAFYFSIYTPNVDASVCCKTPLGAPIPTEYETRVKNSGSRWHPSKTWRKEVRVFVRQSAESVISYKIGHSEVPEVTARAYLNGFTDAEVRVFLPQGKETTLEATQASFWSTHLHYPLIPFTIEETVWGKCAVFQHITGLLQLTW